MRRLCELKEHGRQTSFGALGPRSCVDPHHTCMVNEGDGTIISRLMIPPSGLSWSYEDGQWEDVTTLQVRKYAANLADAGTTTAPTTTRVKGRRVVLLLSEDIYPTETIPAR